MTALSVVFMTALAGQANGWQGSTLIELAAPAPGEIGDFEPWRGEVAGAEHGPGFFDPISQTDTVHKEVPPRPSTPPDTLTRPDAPFTPGRAEMPAGGARPDTSRARILEVGRGTRATASTASDPRLRPWHERPRWVMLRSLVLPGWGQFHNRAWLKGIAVAGGEAALIAGIVDDERALSRLEDELDAARVAGDDDRFVDAVEAYNSRLDRTIARRWFLGAVLAYALIDAYVDSHFVDFETQFERDPALPADAPRPTGARLKLRWTF